MSESFLQIALPVPMRQQFTYLLPDKFAPLPITTGIRVVVPFAGRQLVGVITGIVQQTDLPKEKIKAISQILTDDFPLPNTLVKFITTCANYYHHPLGEVFQLALPVVMRKIDQSATQQMAAEVRWHANVSNKTLADSLLSKRAVKQQQLFAYIEKHRGISWPELRTLGFSKSQLSSLKDKELIEEREYLPAEFTWQEGKLNSDDKLSLSVEQAVIVSTLSQMLDSFSCHLIDGVTGSGKTEVYLQIIEQALAKSLQVLVLVPEIGLTPQTLERFEHRFNVPIYLNHSGLNDKERFDTWRAAYQGHAAIIIGTRSTVFTPAKNLGLIIVDEEHDASLKQQDNLRYHARDIAILRARQLNIPIVLGSATPSFETLQNARDNKYHYHQLTKRAGNSVEAKLRLIDVNQESISHGIADSVRNTISETLARDEQVLVFLNRRGFAPAINCKECHWLAECVRCNKPYTLHKQENILVCHHCGDQQQMISHCLHCHSDRLVPLGQGTEQIEQHLQSWFPEHSTVRIDRDSTRRKGSLAKVLQAVHAKEHHILVGTQMLAKGHHFPNVTLVVILDVDGALFNFDFRAAEQMAQLLIQVAGRAGRASKPGKVLIQTQFPEHPLLQDLINNGYQHFAEQALQERQQAKLPPFGYQVLIRAEANYPSYPVKFLSYLASQQYQQCQLIGPMPATMAKKAGKYRYHLIIQSNDRRALHQAVAKLLVLAPQYQQHNRVRWTIDIDPSDFSW